MNRLALATWRIPQVPIEDLEAARERAEALGRRGLAADVGIQALFTLTTCQRVLLVAVAEEPASPADLARAMADAVDVPGAERRIGFDALRHLVEVASSLDALVPGEDQVTGQVRDALASQVEDGLVTGPLHQVLQRVLALAKGIRAEAGLQGRGKRSLADLAVPLLPAKASVAVVGTGAMAKAALDALGPGRPYHVVSRSLQRAQDRAGPTGQAWERERFFSDPPPVDALILCTGSEHGPVLDETATRALIAARDGGPSPLTILDLGLPRNAATTVGTLNGVDLRTISDLARVARGKMLDDTGIVRARQALEEALRRERRRQVKQTLSERIVALREEVDQEVDALVDELLDLDPELDEDPAFRRWSSKLQGRLAHVSQAHLEAVARGEDPR